MLQNIALFLRDILGMLMKLIGACMTFLILAVILAFIPAVPLYFLWNWLMPDIFGFAGITYLQAWGLLLLVMTLFGIKSSMPTKLPTKKSP